MTSIKISSTSDSLPSISKSEVDFEQIKKKKVPGSIGSQGPEKPKMFIIFFGFWSAI